MIKVLIIEDNVEKLKRIISFLETDCNIKPSDIQYAEHVRGGRELLTVNQYDILLLDLVLPFNEDDDPAAESGSRFLEEIHYNPNINIPIHIIGMTEFDSVYQEYYSEFEDKLWSLINFNLQNTDWVDKLKSKIFYLQNFKNKYQSFIENEKKFDIAIITALNTEFEALKRLATWEILEFPNDPIIYYKFILNTKNNNNLKVIMCCINQMGMQATASVASKIIALFSPSNLFIIGICAGLRSSGVNLGDIVVAKQCWDYESGKISDSSDQNGVEFSFKPDMHCLTTDQGIISKMVDFSNDKSKLSTIYNDYLGNKPQTQLNIKFGSVGSGPYVLSSKSYLNCLLQNDRKLIGIDMEGYGIYKAAQFHHGTLPIFIKSVSDFGDDTKEDDFHAYAAYTSSKFTLDFLYHSK